MHTEKPIDCTVMLSLRARICIKIHMTARLVLYCTCSSKCLRNQSLNKRKIKYLHNLTFERFSISCHVYMKWRIQKDWPMMVIGINRPIANDWEAKTLHTVGLGHEVTHLLSIWKLLNKTCPIEIKPLIQAVAIIILRRQLVNMLRWLNGLHVA